MRECTKTLIWCSQANPIQHCLSVYRSPHVCLFVSAPRPSPSIMHVNLRSPSFFAASSEIGVTAFCGAKRRSTRMQGRQSRKKKGECRLRGTHLLTLPEATERKNLSSMERKSPPWQTQTNRHTDIALVGSIR